MLDEFCNRLNPPCHEFLRLEELQLFRVRFLGKDAGDFYQVSPCNGEGVEGIHFFLRESLSGMVPQGGLNDITAQAHAAFSGERLELTELP